MIRAGITGGIGSGKSVVFEIFRLHGVPAFDSDREAKTLNDTSVVVREQLTKQFGEDIYVDGKLDRKRFASIIFENDNNLKIANSIIHPALADYFIDWCNQHKSHSLVVIDSAILFESGFNKYVDKVITVFAPEELRIERVMKRDGVEREKVLQRMQHQMPEEERIRLSDYVIYNDNQQSLIEQTNNLLSCFF